MRSGSLTIVGKRLVVVKHLQYYFTGFGHVLNSSQALFLFVLMVVQINHVSGHVHLPIVSALSLKGSRGCMIDRCGLSLVNRRFVKCVLQRQIVAVVGYAPT